MRIYLEKHTYAPELNRAYLRGVRISAPGCLTIGDVRKLFEPVRKGIYCIVTSTYEGKYSKLNRKYSGYVNSRKEGLEFGRILRAKNPGAVLLNGDILPPANVKVRFRVIG